MQLNRLLVEHITAFVIFHDTLVFDLSVEGLNSRLTDGYTPVSIQTTGS
jgi:hypothetical protein